MFGMMLKAQRDAMELWRRSVETVATAGYVIHRRIAMMGNPATADIDELGRMVPEKLAAFSLANLAMTRALLRGEGMAAGMSAGLKPIHASVAANARRLRKTR